MRAMLTVVAAVGSLVACGPGDVDLSVDVRTDFAPGTELTATHAVLDGVARDHAVAVGEPWLAGVRVADFAGLASGAHTLDVTLLSGTSVLATRRVAITLERSLAVTVVVGRACAGVICPRAGDDPSATTCVNGTCASPACGTSGAPACPACHADGDCAASPVACAPTRCVSGSCLRAPLVGACTATETCDVAAGCVPVGGTPDAGLCHTCCGADTDCPHVTPRCDRATQVCEQCSVATEAIDCAGTSCVAPGTCSTTAVASVATCDACSADHECMDTRTVCVPSTPGATTGWCMLQLGPSCAGAPTQFATSVHATSLGGVVGDYCGPAVGCGPYIAFHRACGGSASCNGGVCGEPPVPVCTFRCSASSECPPGASCNGLGYCQ